MQDRYFCVSNLSNQYLLCIKIIAVERCGYKIFDSIESNKFLLKVYELFGTIKCNHIHSQKNVSSHSIIQILLLHSYLVLTSVRQKSA